MRQPTVSSENGECQVYLCSLNISQLTNLIPLKVVIKVVVIVWRHAGTDTATGSKNCGEELRSVVKIKCACTPLCSCGLSASVTLTYKHVPPLLGLLMIFLRDLQTWRRAKNMSHSPSWVFTLTLMVVTPITLLPILAESRVYSLTSRIKQSLSQQNVQIICHLQSIRGYSNIYVAILHPSLIGSVMQTQATRVLFV